MYAWNSLEQHLLRFLEAIDASLTSEERHRLLQAHLGRNEAHRFQHFQYGPFGVAACGIQTKLFTTVNYQSAALAWTRDERTSQMWKAYGSELRNSIGSFEDADRIIYRFGSHATECILRGHSKKAILSSFFKKYFEASEQCTIISCPIYGCSILEGSFTYSNSEWQLELRRPTRKDLGRAKQRSMYSINEHLPDAMLRMKVARGFNFRDALDRLTIALALFRPGCILHGEYTAKSHVLLSGGDPIGGSGYRKSYSKMYLRLWNSDMDYLREHLDLVLPRMTKDLFDRGSSINPLSLALTAYREALCEPGIWERQIANAVMAIEALLMGDSHSDLKFRASFRSAKLCGYCGYDPIYVRELTSLAYDVRSAYVHGSRCKPKTGKDINRLCVKKGHFCQSICDIVRTMILAYILIDKDKKTLQTHLDDSMLSNEIGDILSEDLSVVRQINQPFSLLRPAFNHLSWRDFEEGE